MKKLMTLALMTLALYSITVSAGETLNGDYICKKGFLGFKKVDSLAIHSLNDGSLQIDMEAANFNIARNCKVTNIEKMQASCNKESNQIILTQKITEGRATITSTLSFEKIRGLVIVKEGEKSGHSSQEVILICRSI